MAPATPDRPQPATAPTVDVLLIEDKPADARVFARLLQGAPNAASFRLRQAATPAQGMDLLRARPADVIVLGLDLQGSTGLATLRRLASHDAPLPAVVVISGADDENVAIDALQAGAHDYVVRGQVDSRQLATAIRHAIERHQAEGALRALTLDLERSRELVRDMGARNARVLEDERQRIARELHDEMGQQLAALRMEIAVLRQGLRTAAPVAADAALGLLLARVDGLVVSVRRIVAELRPPALDGGLAAALDWLVAEFERQTRLACAVDIDGCASLLSADGAAMVFRIAQESLNNVRRHAAAASVALRLHRSGAGCELLVQDDGRGFDASNRPAGFGILGMEERARALGGTLTIRSAPGQGTQVRLRVPLSRTDPGAPAVPRDA